ncbi:MAG TPA: DNA polymerase II [Spirochaetia bacterium]|nr:DNA polymerase II [Spirochaetia bacterium]
MSTPGAESDAAGFIVHAYTRSSASRTQLCFLGRLDTGETFAALLNNEPHRLFVRLSDRAEAEAIAARERGLVQIETSDRSTMDGEACLCLTTRAARSHSLLRAGLERGGVRTYEADLRPHELFLMDRGIHGSLAVRGTWRRGAHVDRVYVDPELLPSTWEPILSVASIDIETNPYGEEILAMAVHHRGIGNEVVDEVFLVDRNALADAAESSREAAEAATADIPWRLVRYQSEKAMLEAWSRRIRELDPDIMTGWNVIDFDMTRITERLASFGLSLRIGRSEEADSLLRAEGRKPQAMIVAGRQVLDAMRLMRSGPRRFADQTLETAAQELLGRGKRIRAVSKAAKLAEITEMYHDDPVALCRYCLEDARLVSDILDSTGLLQLTLKRCLLIGIPLARAWTSIASFDFIYIEAMHRRGLAAPTLGVDRLMLGEAPGGAIISPSSGLFENVFVFDFKSLYPSIIRTFNIDPVSLVRASPQHRRPSADEEPEAATDDSIEAPNGAQFSRQLGLLPAILERFFVSRDEAKRSGDANGAYVYKIAMNSFYGVLGASGCRFAGSDLAGGITSFGQHILFWCRDYLRDQGYRTLYGDTDSLFVVSGDGAVQPEELKRHGQALCKQVNSALADHVRATWRVSSLLELQFEKTYCRFFVPPLRSTAAAGRSTGPSGQGRSKGYAGLVRDGSGAGEHSGPAGGRIEVRGMEAVRRDWTEAAKEFQLGLLALIFDGAARERVFAYVQEYAARVRRGELDEKLVYTKALRKPVAGYTKSAPPHVQAARHMDAEDQSGLISYLWTTSGPQPIDSRSSPIDYDHYLQKQLRPIAASFSGVVGADMESPFASGGQLPLF